MIFKVNLNQGKIQMVQQQKGSIWENLYLFPFDEHSSEEEFLATLRLEPNVLIGHSVHVLSHQRLNYAVIMSYAEQPKADGNWLTLDAVHDLPTPILVPRILTRVENQLAPLF